MSTRLHASTIIALLVTLVINASAQAIIDKNRAEDSPEQQFGIGINNAGLHIQFAMGRAFHLGMNLNLDVNSIDGSKQDIYHFGPYAKFIFSGGIIKPYMLGAVGVLQPGSGKIGLQSRTGQADSFYVYLPDPELSIKIAGGAEYFFSRNIGLYGHVNVFTTVLHPTPTRLNVGLLGAVVGAEFFF